MKRVAAVALVISFALLGVSYAHPHEVDNAVQAPVAEIGPSNLATDGKALTIRSFDLSSDGDRIILLYQTREGQATWVALWDIPEKRMIGSAKLAEDNLTALAHSANPAGPIFSENYVFVLKLRTDIIFSADQKHAVAMAYGRVWIVDGTNCSTVRSIDPPRLGMFAPVRIQALNNSTFAITYQYGLDRFQVDFYDFATGNKIATWSASAAPQSFSPDKKLVAAPDPTAANHGGVTNVQILDARTGEKLKSIAVGFRFGKSWLGFGGPAAHGSVLSHFLTDTRIVVAPDGQRDAAGHHSGNSLEIIDIPEGRIVGELRPKRFGPTDVLVESPDRSHFGVLSIYAAPFWFSTESSNPAHFTDELMLFANDGRMPVSVFPWPIEATTTVPPRISADASLVAMLLGETVQVFRVGGQVGSTQNHPRSKSGQRELSNMRNPSDNLT